MLPGCRAGPLQPPAEGAAPPHPAWVTSFQQGQVCRPGKDGTSSRAPDDLGERARSSPPGYGQCGHP